MAEFDTKSVALAQGSVGQVEWSGNDAILVTYEGIAVLVGPFADTLELVFLSFGCDVLLTTV